MQSDNSFFSSTDKSTAVVMEKHHVHGTEMPVNGTDFFLGHEIQQVDFETTFLGQGSLDSRHTTSQNGVELRVLAVIV